MGERSAAAEQPREENSVTSTGGVGRDSKCSSCEHVTTLLAHYFDPSTEKASLRIDQLRIAKWLKGGGKYGELWHYR
jgi:hypothetical protein